MCRSVAVPGNWAGPWVVLVWAAGLPWRPAIVAWERRMQCNNRNSPLDWQQTRVKPAESSSIEPVGSAVGWSCGELLCD